jgi:hypothetical protein
MFIDYVDLPTIPEHLLETTNDIIARPPLGVRSTYGIVKTTYDVQRRKINDNLQEWLQSICEFQVNAQYLLLNSAVPIHKDPPFRPQAYNYILDPGGLDVATNVYSEDKSTILKSLVIPAKTWYCLDTGLWHGVTGINPNSWRVLVTIDIDKK